MVPIEINAVSLIYDTPGGSVSAVEDVSFEHRASEFLCLVGPSGCGKTTLLNMIAGFLSPTSGEIRIGGRGVDRPRLRPRRRVPGLRPVVPVAHRAWQCHFRARNEGHRPA